MFKAKVRYWEFENAHVKAPFARVSPALTSSGLLRKGCIGFDDVPVSRLKLATALARSGATLAPDEWTGFWQSAAAFARVQMACRWVKGELRARPNLTLALRDSSRTALAGELGQAMTWLYAVDKLKMPAVVDFSVGCALLNPGAVPGPGNSDARPDFLAANGAMRNVVILESKGSILRKLRLGQWKSDLADGLTQTAAGFDWLNAQGSAAVVSNKYAVSFGLIEEDRSLAVVVDPPEETGAELGESSSLGLLRRHVANWACAAGLLKLATALVATDSHKAVLKMVSELPETELHGHWMKSAGWWRDRPWLPHGGVIHLISSSLLQAVAENNLAGALSAIADFRGVPAAEATRTTPPIWGDSDADRFVAFSDGTAAEQFFEQAFDGPWDHLEAR